MWSSVAFVVFGSLWASWWIIALGWHVVRTSKLNFTNDEDLVIRNLFTEVQRNIWYLKLWVYLILVLFTLLPFYCLLFTRVCKRWKQAEIALWNDLDDKDYRLDDISKDIKDITQRLTKQERKIRKVCSEIDKLQKKDSFIPWRDGFGGDREGDDDATVSDDVEFYRKNYSNGLVKTFSAPSTIDNSDFETPTLSAQWVESLSSLPPKTNINACERLERPNSFQEHFGTALESMQGSPSPPSYKSQKFIQFQNPFQPLSPCTIVPPPSINSKIRSPSAPSRLGNVPMTTFDVRGSSLSQAHAEIEHRKSSFTSTSSASLTRVGDGEETGREIGEFGWVNKNSEEMSNEEIFREQLWSTIKRLGNEINSAIAEEKNLEGIKDLGHAIDGDVLECIGGMRLAKERVNLLISRFSKRNSYNRLCDSTNPYSIFASQRSAAEDLSGSFKVQTRAGGDPDQSKDGNTCTVDLLKGKRDPNVTIPQVIVGHLNRSPKAPNSSPINGPNALPVENDLLSHHRSNIPQVEDVFRQKARDAEHFSPRSFSNKHNLTDQSEYTTDEHTRTNTSRFSINQRKENAILEATDSPENSTIAQRSTATRYQDFDKTHGKVALKLLPTVLYFPFESDSNSPLAPTHPSFSPAVKLHEKIECEEKHKTSEDDWQDVTVSSQHEIPPLNEVQPPWPSVQEEKRSVISSFVGEDLCLSLEQSKA